TLAATLAPGGNFTVVGGVAAVTGTFSGDLLIGGGTDHGARLGVNFGASDDIATFESTDTVAKVYLVDSVGSVGIKCSSGALHLLSGGDAGAITGTAAALILSASQVATFAGAVNMGALVCTTINMQNQALSNGGAASFAALTATTGTFTGTQTITLALEARIKFSTTGAGPHLAAIYSRRASGNGLYIVSETENIHFVRGAGSAEGAGAGTKSLTIDSSGNFDFKTGTTKFNTVTYTWPASDGNAGDQLTTDGSGTLSWAAP
ncbi:hypothetical protein LCGC14_2765210, partial [marine sediment metagenome]